MSADAFGAADTVDDLVAITGRQLALPPGPIFHLQRAGDARHELGAFRAWAGYKDLGAEGATNGLVRFQHVLSFGATEDSGRTGIHCHLAHVHIVIPTSGRGVFSYDGIVTEAVPGVVICQHGGTVHDQFDYSFAPASEATNRATPISLEPTAPGAPVASFGFLELFVPEKIADVEIMPPEAVTAADQASAWAHPYHAARARFAVQSPGDPDAAYRPVSGLSGFEARDAATWGASGGYVATWFVRPGTGAPHAEPLELLVAREDGGLEILFVAAGEARFQRPDGSAVTLSAGDCLTASAGLAGGLAGASPDLRLVKVFVSDRAQALRERTPSEIERLVALGPRIVTRREVRPAGDRRAVNFLTGRPASRI